MNELSLEELDNEIETCNAEIKHTQMSLTNLKSRLNRLTREKQRRTPKKSDIRVSDHALIRYLERVKGIDVIKLRQELMTPDILSAISAGATSITINGVIIKVSNGTITTVVDETRSKY